MKIKNITIMAEDFNPAFQRLLKKDITVKECITLAQVLEKINEQLGAIETTKLSMIDDLVVKKEDGSIKTGGPNNASPVYKSEEAEKQALQKYRELAKEEFEIDLKQKVKLKPDTEMSTADYMLLKDFIEVLDE